MLRRRRDHRQRHMESPGNQLEQLSTPISAAASPYAAGAHGPVQQLYQVEWELRMGYVSMGFLRECGRTGNRLSGPHNFGDGEAQRKMGDRAEPHLGG